MSRHARPHRGVFALSVVVAILAVVLSGYIIWSSNQSVSPDATSTPPPSMPSTHKPKSPSPSPSRATKRVCEGQRPFVPLRVSVPSLKLDMPIDNLSLREDGRYPVPLFEGSYDPRWSAARWDQNAKACAKNQGVVRLGLHTYSDGGASGNLLGNKVQAGSVVQLYGMSKQAKACYTVTPFEGDLTPTWYNADVPYDRLTPVTGKGGVVFEFCWDKPSEWGQWLQHRYVVAKPALCG